MNENKSRSAALLDKVYNHLDSIDVSTLSMSEIKDFLEVVQKGQFLETYTQIPQYGFGLANSFGTSFNGPNVGQGNADVCTGNSTATNND